MSGRWSNAQPPPHEVRGARGTLGKLLASNDPKIIPASPNSKPRPFGPGELATLEALTERLAYGEVLPDNLTELRRLWWELARQGIRLPAQPGVIVIHGGRDG